MYVYQALKTPQFWLIWIVLCMNVTAGIGVLGQASAMSQEMFPGRVTAAAAGGFVGLLSIFNMAGRFFWASTSDYIGRKNTYFVFFVLGFVLYALVPYFGGAGNLPLFVLCFVVIISMYGGGFATVPAYLRDMFGTRYVGAIHGALSRPGQWRACSARFWSTTSGNTRSTAACRKPKPITSRCTLWPGFWSSASSPIS